MMKKTGLLLLAVMGVAGLAVGCSSQEAVESPETAQQVTGAEAQISTEQTGAVVQADPSAQGVEVQSVPATPAAQQPTGQE